MSIQAVLGLQWGDEGKAKITDLLAKDSDYIVRFQGGANAGHTVIVGKEKFVFHLIPSGMFYEHTKCMLGSGMVIDIDILFDEIKTLEDKNINVDERLGISNRAHIVFPFHKKLDGLREIARGNKSIGTTLRGIGPCYEDKITRKGLRFGDMRNWELFTAKLKAAVEFHNSEFATLYQAEPLNFEEIYANIEKRKERLLGMICDVGAEIRAAEKAGKKILMEGAQGSMLDIDHGTYPFCTSSVTTGGNIFAGSGLSPKKIKVVGIIKAYCTRVGTGPFPSELDDECGEHLGTVGHEFGATTKRKRRCGWLDIPAVKYAVALSGVDELYLTKLDVMTGLKEFKVVTGYEGYADDVYPSTTDELENVKIQTAAFEGWEQDISKVRKLADLPPQAQDYLKKLTELIGVPVTFVSVGPERNDNISLI